MKLALIQPYYSVKMQDADGLLQWMLDTLDSLDGSCDLIVLPENADIPALARTEEDRAYCYQAFNARLLEKCAETAKRCGAMLFANARSEGKNGRLCNTTWAFDRTGTVRGRYLKRHLTPRERTYLDASETETCSLPTIVEMEGLRFGFLTCYDFYFYEAFSALARQNPDIIIGCSHQRTDTKTALELLTQNCAYNTGAYVARASVSMGEESKLGGCSMLVAPDGTVLCNMESRIGVLTAEFDPREKYMKPAGFGNPVMQHKDYIEQGRRPWQYRPAGAGIVLPDAEMPYPRVCAHRGLNTVLPENSMPAFGAAVALGAQEIEFDLRQTADGEIVSVHDGKLDRISNGTGLVSEHTLAELQQMDFGIRHGEGFHGLRIPTFEDILRKFACRTVMNIHIKSTDALPFSDAGLQKVIGLIRKYDCAQYVYFMCGHDDTLRRLGELAPDIARCVGAGGKPYTLVERAVALGCRKIQLFKDEYTPEMIAQAHAHDIVVNAFYADTPDRARMLLEQGVDCILTNDCLQIMQTVSVEQKKDEKPRI